MPETLFTVQDLLDRFGCTRRQFDYAVKKKGVEAQYSLGGSRVFTEAGAQEAERALKEVQMDIRRRELWRLFTTPVEELAHDTGAEAQADKVLSRANYRARLATILLHRDGLTDQQAEASVLDEWRSVCGTDGEMHARLEWVKKTEAMAQED